MVLVAAGGAEEQHSNTASEVLGPWGATVQTTIDLATFYSGAAAFRFADLAAGSSKASTQTAAGWWSYAAYLPAYGNGTYRYMWNLGHDGVGIVYLGWAVGANNNEHQIRLVTRTGTYDSTAEFTNGQWHCVKVEFDEGVWRIWASDNGAAFPAIATPTLAQDDSGTYQTLVSMGMDVTANTDETKGANQIYIADDCLFWDPTGDNWNSLIGVQDFPRISEAHMPDTAGAKTESDAGQAAKIDDIPPDGEIDTGTADVAVSTTAGSPGTLTDTRTPWVADEHNGLVARCVDEWMPITDGTTTVLTGGDWSADPGDGFAWEIVDTADDDIAGYWTDIEDLKDVANGGGIPNDAVIQALMITRADFASDLGPGAPIYEFNVREGGVLSADSAEGGIVVQWGASVAPDDLVTYAGYYPWTPGEVNWTQAVFEACQYGCALVGGETDQITVQVIFFGSAHEWEPPAGAARRIFIT